MSSTNAKRQTFSLNHQSYSLDNYRLNEKEMNEINKLSASNNHLKEECSLLSKDTLIDMNESFISFSNDVNTMRTNENNQFASNSSPNRKIICLTEREIFNHIYLSLFRKTRTENFTCMLESHETLDEMNKKFNYANYEMLLEKVWPYLKNKSQNGVHRCYFTGIQVNISQMFKKMDKDFDKRLSFSEFYNGILSILYEKEKQSINASQLTMVNASFNSCYYKEDFGCELEIDEKAIVNLFNQFDSDNDGFIGFAEFVKGFNIPMCQQRINVLNKAFEKLDSNRDGYLDRSDIKCWLMSRPWIDSIGIQCEEFVEKAISLWMINFRDPKQKRKLNQIDKERFILYYTAISSTIIDDSYFDLLIKNTYNIV